MLDLFYKNLNQMENNIGSIFDINLDTEKEYITLPSLGYFYKGIYKNQDKIKVRKLSWIDEDILTTQSYYNNDILLEEILKNTVEDINFLNQLIPIDREIIIYWLRIGAFGKDYEVQYKCTNKDCGKFIKHTWDFGLLKMPKYPEKYLKEIKEKSCVSLKLGKTIIEISPPSFEKESIVNKFIKDIKESKSTDLNSTKNLLTVIKKINFENIFIDKTEEIYKWLTENKISIQDSRKIQNIAREISLNINYKETISCPHCNNIQEKYFPKVTKYFFGLNLRSYREYLLRSINFLVFWGKLDYQSCLRMPTYKRRIWCDWTNENLNMLYTGKK